MIAFAWLFLTLIAGWKWSQFLFRQPQIYLQRICCSEPRPEQTVAPAFVFRASAAVWLGILPVSWLTYILASFLRLFLPAGFHPLTLANILVVSGLFIYLALPRLLSRLHMLKSGAVRQIEYAGSRHLSWPGLMRSLQKGEGRFYFFSLLLFSVYAAWLMFLVFNRSGSNLRAGYSVFGDFAPHTALISSFARGINWPTQYPHFAGDGIAYHFMFYFLCGNLDFLGLPTDWAVNLPSILGFVTFCSLLGTLAVCLTGKRFTFLLAPTMLFLRSSMAFFTFLSDLVSQYGWQLKSWPLILRRISVQSIFIGNTPRDDWGLWSVNVYANQRHLLPGLSLALLVVFLFLPDLTENLQYSNKKYLLLRRFGWLPQKPDAIRRAAAAALICALLPYWHGSALVALLLILSVLAVFSRNRLSFLLAAGAAFLGALIQSAYFSGKAGAVQLQFFFGFIAEDKSFPGILIYLLEMSGLALPMLLALFFTGDKLRRIMLGAFFAPLIFAFTVSLTPDITVNHKYIIITLALGNIYIADLLGRLWSGLSAGKNNRIARYSSRLAAVLLAFALMVTGIQEIVILRNINRNFVTADLSSPLVRWIEENTEPSAVFVTAPYHYHSFFLAGRYAWLGHSYYAWSAGHDTGGRQKEQEWLLQGGGGDLQQILAYIDANGLDYLLIDNELRQHPQFDLDENFFRQNFQQAAVIPGIDDIVIIDLKQRIEK